MLLIKHISIQVPYFAILLICYSTFATVDFRSKATARYKKLEQYTAGCVKSSGRRVEETWKTQHEQR